jgi:hypothetical protein
MSSKTLPNSLYVLNVPLLDAPPDSEDSGILRASQQAQDKPQCGIMALLAFDPFDLCASFPADPEPCHPDSLLRGGIHNVMRLHWFRHCCFLQ